jgi:pimeloyl-ACP methyl ester carboxylesterase
MSGVSTFYGFGHSDPYPEMNEPPDAHPPLCRAEDAVRQLANAVPFILEKHDASSLSIIAHSWGTMVACRFACEHATDVDRLVLFGPISRRPQRRHERAPSAPVWRVVTLEDQWQRFVEDVPPNQAPVLSRVHFEEWGERCLGQRSLEPEPESRWCEDPDRSFRRHRSRLARHHYAWCHQRGA